MEQLPNEDIAAQYDRLLDAEPKIVTNYVPSNATEQRQAFLSNQIRNPDHHYPKLESIDYEDVSATITSIGEQIAANPTLNPKYVAAYEAFVVGYLKKTRLMQLAHDFKATQEPTEKEQIKAEYMALNKELYGEPNETTYRSLLQEQLEAIKQKNLTGHALELRDELFGMVGYDDTIEKVERFKPQDETIQWMHEAVKTLYGGMLAHVSDKETFSVEEMRELFETIIFEEFGEAAEGWKVDVEPAKSINVKAAEKRIVIPKDRGDISRHTLRQLIVHEIGVHMLRSIIGGETDLHPLKNGLDDYYDAEEGLGKVMEQALDGKFTEAGVGHYITAGMVYYDQTDFRDTFERKWRLGALSSVDESGEISDETIEKAKKAAYGATMRIMRGTDELPWFKDLSYYNGSVDMWRHLESIRGDDIKFMFVLMGKANPASGAHERIQYETATA